MYKRTCMHARMYTSRHSCLLSTVTHTITSSQYVLWKFTGSNAEAVTATSSTSIAQQHEIFPRSSTLNMSTLLTCMGSMSQWFLSALREHRRGVERTAAALSTRKPSKHYRCFIGGKSMFLLLTNKLSLVYRTDRKGCSNMVGQLTPSSKLLQYSKIGNYLFEFVANTAIGINKEYHRLR